MTTYEYDGAGRLVGLTHAAPGGGTLSGHSYELDGVGRQVRITETGVITARVVSQAYDPLDRLVSAGYSTGEQFEYAYTSTARLSSPKSSLSAGDAVGNRTVMTSVTPISGTVITTHTYDAANRLTARGRSDG